MLKQRLISGSLIGAIVLGVFFLFHPHLLMLMILAICVLGLLEYFKLLESAGIPHRRMTGTICGALMLLVNWVAYSVFSFEKAVAIEWITLVLVLAALFISQFARPYSNRPLTSLSSTLLGIVYIGILAGFYPKLLLIWDTGNGRYLLLFMVFVVKFGDIGAYFIGSRFGRNKLIPHVSPNKTWEGVFGALVAGLLVSLAWLLISRGVSDGALSCVRFRLVDAIILGIVLPIVGIFSDLTESFIKRAVGAKDSSKLIQGMGGVLDVTDSLLFSAPVLFIYAWVFMERIPVQ